MRARTRAALLGSVLIATGCGTYRTGYFSMPYVGEVAGIGESRVIRMRHCILLDVRPAIDGISFEPKLVSMSINGTSHAAETTERYLGTGSRSEILTQARIPLAQGQWNRFGLCFPEAAAPDQNITLDLSRALRHPDNLPFPLIKFQMQSYRRLYS